MAILTEEELESRLENPGNFCREHGRKLGSKELSDEARTLIGIASHFDTAKTVSEQFGVSPITAHKAKTDPKVRDIVEDNLGRIQNLAISKMLVAMNAISESDIRESKLQTKSLLAKDMATIIEKTREKRPENIQQAQVIIYAPPVRQSSDYETVTVEKVS